MLEKLSPHYKIKSHKLRVTNYVPWYRNCEKKFPRQLCRVSTIFQT